MQFKESYIDPVQEAITAFFWDSYYQPLKDLLQEPMFNSSNQLINAIRTGKIQYKNNQFTGTFSARISKELSRYAKFNRRTKVWTVTGYLPSDVRAAAVTASNKMDRLIDRINASIDQMEAYIPAAIEDLRYPIENPIREMTEEADKDVRGLGLSPVQSLEWEQKIAESYTENMDFYIQKWNPEQITRMREMVERATLVGVSRNGLIEMIESEWSVTANKARFLARNESMLLSAAIRDERYQDAGIVKYRWSTAGDERVRDSHEELNGKVFYYDSPPIIDTRTGQRGNPGQTYNCRCSAIAILS